MVDAAIERIALERGARQQHAAAELARRIPTEANLARHDAAAPLKMPTRLRWKGIDVSDEFRQYAERVARGEDLPPFEGRVLAEPHPAFPWGDGAIPDAEPPKRGTHPAIWAAAIVVLGLLGWSIALELQAPDPTAVVETTVAPLAASSTEGAAPTADVEANANATPADVVDTPPVAARTEPAVAEAAIEQALVASASKSPAASAPVVPALPTPRLDDNALPSSAAPRSAAAAAGASVSVDLSRPGSLGQAVGAALAGRSASPAPAGAAPAAGKAATEDEFGIMAAVSPAPVDPTAGNVGAVAPAPAGAKSNGSVGDLSRAAQPGGSGVRKEPGSESSAKGSLLVETPSF